MYLKGMEIKAIERSEGVPNPLIIYWIKHYASILKSKLNVTEFPQKLSQIEILEIDELYSLVKKVLRRELFYGGKGGIRTLGGGDPTPVFKTGALNHSTTFPE